MAEERGPTVGYMEIITPEGEAEQQTQDEDEVTINKDTGEQEWKGIPEGYWPKCDWCKDFLGEGSIKSSGYHLDGHKICEACTNVIYKAIEDRGGYILGELLSKHGDGASEDLEELGFDDIEGIARNNQEANK
jgi:hypothetical protein